MSDFYTVHCFLILLSKLFHLNGVLCPGLSTLCWIQACRRGAAILNLCVTTYFFGTLSFCYSLELQTVLKARQTRLIASHQPLLQFIKIVRAGGRSLFIIHYSLLANATYTRKSTAQWLLKVGVSLLGRRYWQLRRQTSEEAALMRKNFACPKSVEVWIDPKSSLSHVVQSCWDGLKSCILINCGL